MLLNFLIFTLIACAFSGDSSDKLRIDIFIESECPYSIKFIQEQVKANYELIKDDVKITYIPFGKAKSFKNESGTFFECQHGPVECHNNLYQSCGLDIIGTANMDRQTKFIICAMNSQKSEENCNDENELKGHEIEACINGSRGTELQLAAERMTNPIIQQQSHHVPTITFEGIFNEEDDSAALGDFYQTVQRKLKPKVDSLILNALK
jgi:interferon gamma-inducible protein 30